MAKIIAADDDIYLQRIYYYMLDGLGHDITICCNGEEAVEAFIKNGADLVILDISMPIMDGLAACRQIKQSPQGVSTPVIIVSGNDKEEEVTLGLNAGADDYMIKPIQENVLVAKLKNFLKTASLNRKEFDLVKHHTVLLDRYRIEKVLGYGAHSVVFLATDQKGQNQVAVKILNEQVSDENIRRCFVAMVTQYKVLDHPNITKIIDHGVLNNQLYLIMDYAPNGNLRQRITAKRFNEDEVCALGLQMVAALKELAAHDLTHLDVKPENIICMADRYQLTDFGLALSKNSDTMPIQAEIWSTAAYICPECLEGINEPTIKSDIYSLGLTLFEAVAGDNPFFAGRPTVSMFRQVNLIPPYLSNQAENISYQLSDVIAAMMNKDPADRPNLDELDQWFEFIRQCHADGLTDKQLKYPRLGEQRKLVAVQESVIYPRRQTVLQPPRRKMLPERIIEHIGQIAYNFIMLQEHRGLVGKITLLRKFAYAAVVMVTFTYLTYSALASFRYEAGKQQDAPLCRLACPQCKQLEDHKVKDINKEKCSHCGAAMGYALQCRKCKRTFAWQKPEIPADASEKTKKNILQKSMACPFCKSTLVEVVPPAKPEPPKNPNAPTGRAAGSEPTKKNVVEPAKAKGKS